MKTHMHTCSKKLGTLQTRAWMVFPALFAILLVTLALAPGAQAQGITGSITGTVTDSTGAIVSGAAVTVRNVDTNATRNVTTSDIGSYMVPQLHPGNYSVKVNKAGFKLYEQSNVTVQIDQVVLIDAQLQVGSEQTTVTVTTSAPVLQTENSSVGEVIDSIAIQNTPLNGRLSVMGLVALAPGIQGVGAQDQMATRGMTFAAGTGSRNAYGSLGSTLDGVTNTEVTLQRAEPEVPSLDALSEFKVLATGAPAEFNQPTQIIVVTAGGTNRFHGELLEYNRSKGTAAKSYFNGSTARPPYERNEFGGNFAGPVLIPHVYNGKDRTFFFFAYEGFRLTQSTSKSTQQPSDLQRAGCFSTSITDPTTGAPFAIATTGTCAGYYQIPSGRFNSVDQQLLTLLYPKATVLGTGTNTYENVPYKNVVDRFSLRLDHRINEANSIRFTWLRAFYGPNTTVGNDSLQGGMSGDGEHNSQFILGYTHTFSPSLVFDMNGSFFHLPIYRTPQNVGTNWESIIPGMSPQSIEGAPQISITNITAVGESGSKDLEQVGQINTSLTKVLSKHTLKAGVSYLYDNHWNVSAGGSNGPARGSYTFTNNYTGVALANFMLGLPTSTAQNTPASLDTRNISSQWGAYIQDDWKPMPKLTINMGIRYDLQWFAPGPYNQNSLWIPEKSQVVVFGSSYPSTVISAYQTLLTTNNLLALSSSSGMPNDPFAYLGRDTKNFAPRLGFAYQLMHNTVLRGAAGIYFNLLPASYMGSGVFGDLPFQATQTYTNTPHYASGSTFTMSAPFSGTGTAGGRPGVYAEHNLVTPYTEEYNLALEHQFSHSLDLRVGYVGQHNLKQNNYGGTGTTTPNLNLADPFDITKTPAATALFPVLGAITQVIDPMFHSTMNSLQVGLHKQYSKGLAFGAEYQWIRVLGTENIEDPSGKYPRDSYGPISGITPQVLQFNYSYMLPLGQGQLLFSNAGPVVDKIVKGWQISGATDIQTGQPFSVTYTASTSVYPGAVSGRANQVGDPYQSGTISANPTCTPKAGNTKTNAQWFNYCAFTAPTNSAGVAGGAYGTSGYNMLRGPGFQDWDMSLQKNTKWMEHYNIQLRADAFNLANHPNFAVPNSVISNTNVGTITGISGTPTYEARTMEFAVKFNF
jgi:hypothetical protein